MMKFNFPGNETPPQIPTKVDRWYDRLTRNWVVQLLDQNGYQIGEAIYVYTKEEAMREEKRLKEGLR